MVVLLLLAAPAWCGLPIGLLGSVGRTPLIGPLVAYGEAPMAPLGQTL